MSDLEIHCIKDKGRVYECDYLKEQLSECQKELAAKGAYVESAVLQNDIRIMAAQQARIAELVEALRLCYDHCRLYHREVERNNVGQAVREALSRTDPTEALDAYHDQVLEEAAKACHDIQMEVRASMYDDHAHGWGEATRKCWKAIRALKKEQP